MQITREQINPTTTKLTVAADKAELDTIKEHVLKQLTANVKVPGFRAGKAPAHLVEKQLDPAVLQTEFMEHAVNDLYVDAVQQEKLRPVGQPTIAIVKFVPFSTLEFTAEAETVGSSRVDLQACKLEYSIVSPK